MPIFRCHLHIIMIMMAHSQFWLVFFHCTSSFCFPHFNSQLQPTDPFSVASLKDIPLWAITKEPNSSGQTVGSIRIHQHKICTIHKVTTIASNITAKQTECLITHRHQQTDWNYSCVCAVYTQRYITVTVLRTLLYSSWSVLRVKQRAVSVMITFASAFLEK